MVSKPMSKSESKSSSGFFSPGSLVEINSDHEGFRGSWFSGTIVRPVGPHSFLVEYDSLVADEEGTEKLRETVKIHQLRPIPPPETGREFKFGDEVDAFNNDGWWEGHITHDLGNGRFAVYFRPTKEQIEFSKERLRLHREWMNEKWIPPFEQQPQPQQPELQQQSPPKQQQEVEVLWTPELQSDEDVKEMEDEEMFSIGKLVEVSSDDECFLGAWFSATIVQVIEKDKFLVEYQTLLGDDSQPLKEEVDIQHIRPHPPEASVNGEFSLLEEVDALYVGGWWVGVISKIFGNSRYEVYFRSSNEEIEFNHSQLRPHQDWIDGTWFMASELTVLKFDGHYNIITRQCSWKTFCVQKSIRAWWRIGFLQQKAFLRMARERTLNIRS